ncbi:MAG: winged helix-turn-helix transcriptional regulator [Nitrososphaeraceae archaeon]
MPSRLKELQKSGILERQSYNETPPRVEYKLTNKGQELVEPIVNLSRWMRKWNSTRYAYMLKVLCSATFPCTLF